MYKHTLKQCVLFVCVDYIYSALQLYRSLSTVCVHVFVNDGWDSMASKKESLILLRLRPSAWSTHICATDTGLSLSALLSYLYTCSLACRSPISAERKREIKGQQGWVLIKTCFHFIRVMQQLQRSELTESRCSRSTLIRIEMLRFLNALYIFSKCTFKNPNIL